MVKVEIPRELNMAIIKVQAENDLDFSDACKRVAELAIFNNEKVNKEINRKAERIYRSRLMTELNKSRQTIKNEAWKDGREWTRKNEDNFRVPCSVCGESMCFSSRDKNRNESRSVLYEAFKMWRHTSCGIQNE